MQVHDRLVSPPQGQCSCAKALLSSFKQLPGLSGRCDRASPQPLPTMPLGILSLHSGLWRETGLCRLHLLITHAISHYILYFIFPNIRYAASPSVFLQPSVLKATIRS